MVQTYFTDQEYRLVLRALQREQEVCEKFDKESNRSDAGQNLITLMNSIERKIEHVQYHYHGIHIKTENAETGERE